MVLGDDSNIGKLLSDVKNLFQGRANTGKKPEVAGALPSGDIAPGNYQSPIKSSWKSSGGFARNVKRPNGSTNHLGVDMRAAGGTAIYPLAPGVVTSVGTDPKGGNIVNIQHANGVRSYYAHMSSVKVHKGDRVNNDTVIGTVGDSGNAKGTWPHLHFQVWENNQIQDPAKYFNVPAYSNPDKVEMQAGQWISDKAKQDAQAFNMQEHVAKQRVAFSRDVDQLLKAAEQFYKLSCKG